MSFRKAQLACSAVVLFSVVVWSQTARTKARGRIGQEVAIPVHMQDGDEYRVSTRELIDYGRKLFTAMWSTQEGAGRPLTKGTGAPLSDPASPLVFPRNFNRISGPTPTPAPVAITSRTSEAEATSPTTSSSWGRDSIS